MLATYDMSRRTALTLAATVAFSLSGSLAARIAAAQGQAPDLQSPQAKKVEALVDKAAALIASKGKAAFSDFRQRGSEWLNGDTYIFVGDTKGMAVFNGGFPKLEGTNTLDQKDKNGKFIAKALIEMAKKQGAGWVDYMWPKPGTDNPVKKWSYVKRVDLEGAPAFVGVGIYLQ